MRSPMSSTAATKTTSTGTTSKARPPVGGKASDVSAVIKPTERPGACSWLKMRRRRPVEPRTSAVRSSSVERVAVVEVAVVEVVAIDDRSAVGDIGVVVVNHRSAMPVVFPVIPAPPKSSEESDSKSNTEGDCRASKKDSRHRNPARVGDGRCPVHEPRIIGRHVDHIRVGRLDDDRVALSRYLLLFVAIQLASLPSLLTHRLDGIRHILLLVCICVAKG